MATRIVIVGAGPAGVSAVETLRALDRQAQIAMLSAEPYPPYSPPAMADHFASGSWAHLWREADWAEHMQVDYRSGVTVAAVEPGAKRLRLAQNGGVLEYDRLVIATGSRLYAPLEGAELPGVYNFKSLSAAEALVGKVRRGEARRALIVGAGFIGMEIALLLCQLGVQVTQIEMLDQVMPAMLDAPTASFALQAMRQRGVEVRLNTRGQAFLGEGRAEGVLLESGEVLQADLYIAATGVRPNLELLQGSGIEHRWGITVDEYLRTSAAEVYAAGDVIESRERLSGEVAVHAIFPNAVEQGRVVGMNLAGLERPYEGAERLNSLKHLGVPVLAAGLKQGDEVLQARHNGGQRRLYLKDGRLVGYQLVGDIGAAGALRTLLTRQEDVRRFKDRLLQASFGQGTLAWSALAT
ncbi:MAG: FAD-dependent oxidoreductase [Chloroflexota bacterium]